MFSAILIISMLTILRWAWLSEAKTTKTTKATNQTTKTTKTTAK
jgi:hypothetical protein